MPEPGLAIVVLAAGGSRRFGSPKQLALFAGKPLLEHSLDACRSIAGCQTCVVLGAAVKAVAAGINLDGVEVILNKQWREGMASSIRLAVNTLAGQCDALLFVAGDQVRVGESQLGLLLDTWRQQPGRLIAAEFGGKEDIGIPAIFPQAFFSELLSLKGDRGGKQLLLRHRNGLVTVAMPEAQFDVDYPDDLERIGDC